jgi:hypothetical protein
LHFEHIGQKGGISLRNLGKTGLGTIESGRGNDLSLVDTLEKYAIVGIPLGGVNFRSTKKILHHYGRRKSIFKRVRTHMDGTATSGKSHYNFIKHRL